MIIKLSQDIQERQLFETSSPDLLTRFIDRKIVGVNCQRPLAMISDTCTLQSISN